MATTKIKLMVYQAIKDNLEWMIKTLREQKGDPYDFNLAETAYFKYIGENILATRLTQEIMLEGRLHKPAVREIFNSFVLMPGFKNENVAKYHLSTPPFWNEALEKKYGLRKEFIEMMKSARKEYVASLSKKKKTKVLDKKFTYQEIDAGVDELINLKHALKMLPVIQQLHNNLMQMMDEEIIINASISEEDRATEKRHAKELPENDTFIPEKEELRSITIVTPQFGNFSFLWVVLNNDHKNKIKIPTKNKLTPSDESYGKKLYNIAKSEDRRIEKDKSLMDTLNYSVWDCAPWNKFQKRNILKQENKQTKIQDYITLTAIPVQLLDSANIKYY